MVPMNLNQSESAHTVTVTDLIAQLQRMPPGALVVTSGFNAEGYEVVRTVSQIEARRRTDAPEGTLFGPNVWRESEQQFSPSVPVVLID